MVLSFVLFGVIVELHAMDGKINPTTSSLESIIGF